MSGAAGGPARPAGARGTGFSCLNSSLSAQGVPKENTCGCFFEGERTSVWRQRPRNGERSRCSGRGSRSRVLPPALVPEPDGLVLPQSIRTPKVAFRYFQDLLGKRIDNPHVVLYRSRFPEHELLKDDRRQTVIFKLSQ